jgi:hypothetical protein
MPENNMTPVDALARRAGAVGQSLIERRLVQELLAQASGWSARTAHLQETVLEVLNLPSAVGLSQLERRMRSVSDRIGRLEDQLDSVSDQITRSGSAANSTALGELSAEIGALRALLADRNEQLATTA